VQAKRISFLGSFRQQSCASGRFGDLIFGVKPMALGNLGLQANGATYRHHGARARLKIMKVPERNYNVVHLLLLRPSKTGHQRGQFLLIASADLPSLADVGQTFENSFHTFGDAAIRLRSARIDNILHSAAAPPSSSHHGAIQDTAGLETGGRVPNTSWLCPSIANAADPGPGVWLPPYGSQSTLSRRPLRFSKRRFARRGSPISGDLNPGCAWS